MNRRPRTPVTYGAYRVVVALLVTVPVVLFLLALVGTGPWNDMFESTVSGLKQWFTFQTGVGLP
ncbi:MAG TPA: hypothetical protein VGD15_02900 [Kribbella sp.]|jgi:hypothetical protein